MPKVTFITKHIIDFTTRRPFEFEVDQEEMNRISRYRQQGGENEYLVDFLFFPSREEVRKIFFGNGYTEELVTKILKDFGTPKEKIHELLADQRFVQEIYGWFEDITQDGERAARTLLYVYKAAKDKVLTIDVGRAPERIGP